MLKLKLRGSPLILSILFFAPVFSQYLQLPDSLKNKEIYYIKVKQLESWSCGYNALFNACKLEQKFGNANKFSDYNNFNSTCSNYINKINQKPKGASSNKILEDLSKVLDLKMFYYLTFNERREIVPLFTTPTHITYPSGTSKSEVKHLMLQAIKDRETALINALKKELDQNKNKLRFLHFGCHLDSSGEGHAILISLVQNVNGKRVIYICDNLNSKIDEKSQAKLYIDFINKSFIK